MRLIMLALFLMIPVVSVAQDAVDGRTRDVPRCIVREGGADYGEWEVVALASDLTPQTVIFSRLSGRASAIRFMESFVRAGMCVDRRDPRANRRYPMPEVDPCLIKHEIGLYQNHFVIIRGRSGEELDRITEEDAYLTVRGFEIALDRYVDFVVNRGWCSTPVPR